jgi:biopolymer transport protein ExbD
MAHVDDGAKDGRDVSVDVNIVPFIDLMCVCIIFLLVTAVWTQVSMIQIGSSIYGKKSEQQEPEKPPRAEIPFRVDVKSIGYQVLYGSSRAVIPKKAGDYDVTRLLDELKKVRALYPEKIDGIITIEDELQYKFLIQGMDAMLVSGFSQIGVGVSGAQ